MVFLKFLPQIKFHHILLFHVVGLRRLRRFFALSPSSDWLDDLSIFSFCFRIDIEGIRLFFGLASLSRDSWSILPAEEWLPETDDTCMIDTPQWCMDSIHLLMSLVSIWTDLWVPGLDPSKTPVDTWRKRPSNGPIFYDVAVRILGHEDCFGKPINTFLSLQAGAFPLPGLCKIKNGLNKFDVRSFW